MTTIKDVAWLAGLLEGEGTFGYFNGTPTIQIAMTDRDVIDRAAKTMGIKVRAPWTPKRGKTVYKCGACGVKAVSWMMTLYSLLGERRRNKVMPVIQKWLESPKQTYIRKEVLP